MHLHPQALIPLSLEGTEVGQTKAAQALAKITITSNPEMAFPGERVSVTTEGQTCHAAQGVEGTAGGGCRGAAQGRLWGRGCHGCCEPHLQQSRLWLLFSP